MKKDLFTTAITDEQTVETIKQVHNEFGTILEPHGAVGWNALQEFLKTNAAGLCVSLETAHPSKFPEIIEKALGIKPEDAECIKEVSQKQESFEIMENDYETFKKFLKESV